MKCQKDKFLLQGKIAYLNCAYMSPVMKKVEQAGIRGIRRKRKPYQIGPEDFFTEGETARHIFSKIIGSTEPERSVIIPSVSYGIANVLFNLPKKKGDIVVTEEQFPSNIYPWLSSSYNVKIIPSPQGKNRGKKWNEDIIDAIDDDTAAVAIGHIHWTDGTLFDLKTLRDKTSQHEAALIIDGTQSVGALPFNVATFRPDALVCGGYKWLMGPYSIGMAYYGPMFDNGKPIEDNWINREGSENFGGLVQYRDEYRSGALRYEVGEHSNFILLPMLLAAMKQIVRWEPENIQSYCRELIAEPVKKLKNMGYTLSEDDERSHHLFGIRIPKPIQIEDVQKQLRVHRVNVSTRGDALRISPHVYNTEKDMNRLVRALEAAKP